MPLLNGSGQSNTPDTSKRLSVLGGASPKQEAARLSIFFVTLIFAVFSFVPVSLAVQSQRVAFVVGNQDYIHTSKLDNPISDARAFSEILKLSGFEVTTTFNATRASFLVQFERFLQSAETADIVLIYYAGHGAQISSKNFLIPIDATIETPADLIESSISMDMIYEKLGAFENFKIVFLDACQNNPFTDRHSVLPGLAAVSTDLSQFLVSYAAQPGRVAYDGLGDHSPFTSALLKHVPTTGLEILPMLSRVNIEVKRITGGQQYPYVHYSIKPDFFFEQGTPEFRDVESLFWQVASASNDDALVQLYKSRFPEGKFLQDIDHQGSLSGTGHARNLTGSELEEKLVHLFLKTRDRKVAEYYLSNFSSGNYIDYFRDFLSSGSTTGSNQFDHLCRTYATHPNDSTPQYSGVSYRYLVANSQLALQACRQALEQRDRDPHLMVLYARALAAAGKQSEALDWYQKSSELGDHRAIVSLGLLYETGAGVKKDLGKAEELYERGIALGSPDAAINLATMILRGTASSNDKGRAEGLLQTAMDQGAPRAAYNLGVLELKSGSNAATALTFFEAAGKKGFPRGYLAAADILGNATSANPNPELAAEYLLRAVATDDGEAQILLNSEGRGRWSRQVIREMQAKLKQDRLYTAGVDGLPGPKFRQALERWRSP